jgi:hypothetical protein
MMMQTTRFYNHPESLVRTKTRSILLSILRIENEKVTLFGDENACKRGDMHSLENALIKQLDMFGILIFIKSSKIIISSF